MKNVVFVAPYFGPTMTRVLKALSEVGGTRVGVITQVPEERMPRGIAVAGHYAVDNALDAGQLKVATRAFQKEWGRVDRLIGYLEHMQQALADTREALGIEGMHSDVARRFRDKNVMKKTLAEHGLPVARQSLITGYTSAIEFVERVGFPIILKPTQGVGSKDTFRVGSDEELYAVLNRLLPTNDQPLQGEEFITGEEHTLETVMIEGEAVWQSSTYYLPGPLKVLENPWMQYCVLLPREQHEEHVRQFQATNASALKALGLKTGFSHMEWFLRSDGSHVVSEVGGRPAGVNIMAMNGFAHDVDVWAKWTRLEVHHEWEMPERRYACGCAFLRGHGPGRTLADIEGLESTLAALGDIVVDTQLPRVGQARSAHYEGEGWVLVRAPETQGVVEALKRVVTGIQLRYV
ncbi:MAG: ATP-grasp domain-containing protein [Myxococcota bacterium]